MTRNLMANEAGFAELPYLRIEDEIVELKTGSFINIPAHRRRRIAWTDSGQPTIWLAIIY
jgi:cupin 2 domain-containing protein